MSVLGRDPRRPPGRAGHPAAGGTRRMSADVIVVGAGVAGAATAFHLSLLGAGDVLVVDRGTAGSGMSSRSSAMIRMHYTFRPEVELAVRSDRMFSVLDGADRPPGLRPPDWLRPCRPARRGGRAAGQRGHAAGLRGPRPGPRGR